MHGGAVHGMGPPGGTPGAGGGGGRYGDGGGGGGGPKGRDGKVGLISISLSGWEPGWPPRGVGGGGGGEGSRWTRGHCTKGGCRRGWLGWRWDVDSQRRSCQSLLPGRLPSFGSEAGTGALARVLFAVSAVSKCLFSHQLAAGVLRDACVPQHGGRSRSGGGCRRRTPSPVARREAMFVW